MNKPSDEEDERLEKSYTMRLLWLWKNVHVSFSRERSKFCILNFDGLTLSRSNSRRHLIEFSLRTGFLLFWKMRKTAAGGREGQGPGKERRKPVSRKKILTDRGEGGSGHRHLPPKVSFVILLG